jgi:hypothetical protein
MNKKLFSWKALAGLALLVAMGLTSCKQGTEVDPNDPYNTSKPVQPGVVSGTADLTIRVVKPSDFNTQFSTWIKGLSADDLKAKVTDKSSFTIDVQTGGMKLAEDASVADLTMTIPAQLDGKTVTVNLLNAFAEKKNVLHFNVPANNEKVVTINLPADEFAFDLTNAKAIVDLGGSATISRFTLANAGGQNKPVTIGSGLTIKNYASAAPTNFIKVGGTISALEIAADITMPSDKGYVVDGSLPSWGQYRVKSFVATTDLTIDANGYKGGTIENLYIAAGKKVTLCNTLGSDNGKNNQKPYVNNIYGLGAGSAVEFVQADGLTNIQSISGAAADKQIAVSSFWAETWTSGGVTYTDYYSNLYIYSDILTNAKVTKTSNPLYPTTNTNYIYVYGPSSLSNATLDGYVDVAAPAAVSKFTFNSVAFPTGSKVNLWKVMNLTPILDADGNQVTRDYYAWLSDITNNVWSYGVYADIPASVLALDPTGSRGYWYCYSSTPLYEETGDDIDVTIAFTGCKYNGSDMNTTALERLCSGTGYSAKLTYDLDGKLYRWARVYDKDKGSWGNVIVSK